MSDDERRARIAALRAEALATITRVDAMPRYEPPDTEAAAAPRRDDPIVFEDPVAKWKREADEAEQRRAAAKAELREQEQQMIRAAQGDDIDRRIAAALDAYDVAVGRALAEERKRMRKEFKAALAELREELNVQRAHESGKVVDLPAVPLLRKPNGHAA